MLKKRTELKKRIRKKNAKLLLRWQVEFQKKSGINQIQNHDEQKQ